MVDYRSKRGVRERGAALVEYTVLIAFIAITLVVALNFVGSGVGATLSEAGMSLQSVTSVGTSDDGHSDDGHSDVGHSDDGHSDDG